MLLIDLLRRKPDVLLSGSDFRAFPFYWLWTRLLRIPVVMDLHGIFSDFEHLETPPRLEKKVRRVVEKWVARRADFNIACFNFIYEYFRPFTAKIVVIPLFTDEAVFSPRPKGDAKPYRTIGAVGPFDRSENLILLRFLYDNLARFDPLLRFVVIGKCDWRIEDDRVTYTGYLPTTAKYAAAIAGLDALLAYKEPTKGVYTKSFEAMACGVPVFTTPRGVFGLDHTAPGKDILVFPAAELVDRLNEMVPNDALMRQVGAAGHHTFECWFSKSANRELIFKVFEDIVNGGKKP